LAHPPETRWAAVAAAIFAGVIGGFAYGKMAPALPLMKAEFQLSMLQASWLVSAFNALALTCAIVFGLLSDRVGAFRFCLSGVACMLAGGLLGVAAAGPAVLIASRLLEGLGFLAILVSAPALIMSTTAPARRGVAFGIWSAYMPFGSALIIAGSPLLAAGSGWRGVWMAVAGAAALCIALLALQRGHYAGATAGTRRSFAIVRRSLSQPVPWLLGLAFAMYVAQYNTLMIWLPTYLLEARGMSSETAAMATALFVIINCIGNVFGGWLVQRRIARGRIIGVTFTLTTLIFCGIFAPGVSDGARYALILLYSVVTGPVPAAALSGGAGYARSPAEVGVLQGLIVQITNIGIFFGPIALAAVVSWSGSWDSALWVMMSCATVGLATAFLIGRYERGS
jgi:CP family cyanate transporter-like MFS transporter